nr:hypothetical protein [Tanacetum cinerariifolium]
MLTQQDIYAAGSENRPHMLNKENYVQWSSRLHRYAKSRPNGKLIHNSIINGPYVRWMILEPGDTNCEVPVNETFHVQTYDELTDKELKQIEADDQPFRPFFSAFLKTSMQLLIVVKLLRKSGLLLLGESIESYYHRFLKLMNDLKRNKHIPKKIASNLKFLNNLQPEWCLHVTIVHQKKDLHTADYTQLYDFLKYNQKEVDELRAQRLTRTQDPLALMATSNNPYTFQWISSNPRNRQIAQPGMNMGQDRQMQMVGGNANQNLNGNDNLVAARAEGNENGHTDLDEIEEVNANCILMANLQQASTSGTQTDRARIYDSDGSAEVHNYDNCYDDEIFNMFTQEEQYSELLEPIPKPHQVSKNDNNVISEDSSVEQSEETVEQHPTNIVETRILYDSLYNYLAIEVENVNTVNRKLKETNVELTTELARFKNQEKCFEISQEKYDKLKRCYQKSVYQEQCLSKKINALHLISGKKIMTLNKEILNLNKQLSMEKSTVSSLLEEKKKLKFDFKIREDKLLDKQIQLKKRIKELDNILVKTGQSIQMIHMLSPKPDSFYYTEQKMALGYQNSFYLKQAQQKQQSLYDGKVLLEKHDPPVVHYLEETLQLAQESRLKIKKLNKCNTPKLGRSGILGPGRVTS